MCQNVKLLYMCEHYSRYLQTINMNLCFSCQFVKEAKYRGCTWLCERAYMQVLKLFDGNAEHCSLATVINIVFLVQCKFKQF